MTTTNLVIFIIGSLAAFISGSLLLFGSLSPTSKLWKSARLVYLTLSLMEFYYSTIYALVIFQVLPMTNYGIYLRPIASLIVLSPALIMIIHWPRKTK